MLKVKIIASQKGSELEKSVNQFLKNLKGKFIDIKFNYFFVYQRGEHIYRAYIIYEE